VTLDFQLGHNIKYVRGYHSPALLPPGGNILMDGDPNGGILPNERGGFAMLSVSPDFKQNRRYVGYAITGRTATDGENTIKVRLGIGKVISKNS
jgi:hypothetical protein